MDLLKGTLDLLIMKTLSWGALHGYAISRAIARTTDEELRVEEGALYPALRRLEGRGLVRGRWGKTESGREARFYELTAEGKRRLAAEVGRWERYVHAMGRVLHAERPRP
jgi:PadR family transcriptional regulator PadR